MAVQRAWRGERTGTPFRLRMNGIHMAATAGDQ